MAHPYHRQCGCSACCREEEVAERAEEYAGLLKANGKVLGEAMGELTDEELAAMARDLADGDDLAFGRAMRLALGRHVDELIDERVDTRGCSRFEAVDYLLSVYEVKRPRVRPVLVARAAA